MKLYHSKKGSVIELLMNPIFHTVLALAVVGLILFTALAKVTDKTDFDRTFLSTDMALNIDALYAMPGTVFLSYDKDTKNFSFQFGRNTLNVYEKNKQKLTKYFIEDKAIAFPIITLDQTPVDIAFFKQNNKLEVNYKNEITFNDNFASCTTIEKKSSIKEKSFLLVPEEQAKSIANILKTNHYSHPSFHLSDETFRTDFDIVIELKVLDGANEPTIFYQAASAKNRAFACFISNTIMAETQFGHVNLIPSDQSYFKYIGKDISISIELPVDYPKKIANTIDRGLNKYFKDD